MKGAYAAYTRLSIEGCIVFMSSCDKGTGTGVMLPMKNYWAGIG